MGGRDINEVLRAEGVDAARAMHDDARPFENEGAAILNGARSFLSRFIAYPSEHAKVAHVLWVVHAHLMAAWESTPRIAFLSPEPGSGKTRAMEQLRWFCLRMPGGGGSSTLIQASSEKASSSVETW